MTFERPKEARDFIAGLSAAIQNNPLPAALVGMGVVWLFSGRARPRGLDLASQVRSRASATARSVARSATESLTTVSDDRRGMAMGRGEGGTSVRRIREATADIADIFERQPLVLGVVGLAAGAGVAATLRTNPHSGS